MNGFDIVYKQYGKYSAIIYPVSYLNPMEEIQSISDELKKHLTSGCYVLFDLLLSNGDNFNRFAEVYYDGDDIKTSAVSIAEIPLNEVRGLNLYYRGKVKELSKSVLSAKERYRFATIK